MTFELGDTKSGYRILDVLKRSEHAIEYRVQNTLAQRLEKMTVLMQSAVDDVAGAERFLREMRVRARLIHPNIVTFFNALEIDQHLAMTTELVEGPTLAEHMQSGALPWREAIGLLRQALAALAFAHRHHVVHRDIDPQNMVITPGGVLKLTNFALAKSEQSPKLTQIGAAVGNLKYISPEQVKGIAEVDARSDLYSLGVVLFEAVCGRPPFVSPSQFELMAAHVNQPPPLPSSWNFELPKELDAIVCRVLAKDPADRFQSAVEFDDALFVALDAIEHPRPADEVVVEVMAEPPQPVAAEPVTALPAAETKVVVVMTADVSEPVVEAAVAAAPQAVGAAPAPVEAPPAAAAAPVVVAETPAAIESLIHVFAPPPATPPAPAIAPPSAVPLPTAVQPQPAMTAMAAPAFGLPAQRVLFPTPQPALVPIAVPAFLTRKTPPYASWLAYSAAAACVMVMLWFAVR